ncbi:MAG: hypothetical protein K2N18_01290, partial [Clostridia bacterium]|nr:hypothetical protein [Clostridia bacterium]
MKKLGTMTRKASLWALVFTVMALCLSLAFFSLGAVAFADEPADKIMLVGDGEYKNVRFGEIAAQTFTGGDIEPEVEVYYIGSDSEVQLTKGTDYDITYRDNRDVEKGFFTVTGKGDYTGSADGEFTITPVAINDTKVSIEPASASYYTGEQVKPELIVKIGDGPALVEDVDYTVTWGANVNAGAGSYTVTGAGNLTGSTASIPFTINKATDNVWTKLSIVGWMQGRFDPKVNIVDSAVKYGQETATYTIYKCDVYGMPDATASQSITLNDKGEIEDTNDLAYNALNALEAGDYRLVATAANNTNYNQASFYHSFKIAPLAYTVPTLAILAGQNDTYTGNPLKVTLNDFDPDDENVTVQLSSGLTLDGNVLSATDAGEYTATFTLTED